MLNSYYKYNYKLLPIAINTKTPVTKNWTQIENTDVHEWQGWLDQGLNIGVRCGAVSDLTVIDVDNPLKMREFIHLVGNTLTAKTTKGFHLFYKHAKELPTTRINELAIDILNDGRQCVVPPSVVDGVKRVFTNDAEPIEIPKEFKEYLLNHLEKPTTVEPQHIPEGLRNSTLVSLGGILRKELNIRQTTFVLNIINNKFCHEPIPQKEMVAMVRSLDKYLDFDLVSFAKKVLTYMKLVEVATPNDAVQHFSENRERIDNALSYLVKEGYIVKQCGRYHVIKSIEWKPFQATDIGEPVPFRLPYFNDMTEFYWGDTVMLGASTGSGKTHITMNIIKNLVMQGIEPYLITTENLARTVKIGKQLGIPDGSFQFAYIPELTKAELPGPRKVIIIDWLQIEDFSEVVVYKYLSDMVQSTQALLICLCQLKWDSSWFAPNLIHHYSCLSLRYLLDKEDRTKGQFIVDKNREAKFNAPFKLQMTYNPITKELKEVGDDVRDFKEVFNVT